MTRTRPLRGLSEIRLHMFRDQVPTWYACHHGFDLMSIDEWVGGFRYVTYVDCFDGRHPNVFPYPRDGDPDPFPTETLEALNNKMLEHPAVAAHIREQGPGRAIFLLFDERTEELCRELDLELMMPPAALRRKVDDKVSATRIGNQAGVPSVPNVLGKVTSYEELRALAADLGDDLVIQTPFGDSGATTFYVAREADWNKCEKHVKREAEVKVMRRIRPMAAAQEACVTSQGTIVGPLMTEIIGFAELTPYRGGWAGNEVSPTAFTDEQRRRAADWTARIGDEIARIGYRGYFEIDWLVDRDDGSIYLGEINPRVTGATSMTNLAAFSHADAPLFLFHLLELSGVPFELDVAALNARWADPANMDDWSQLIVKHVAEPDFDTCVRITAAPASGVYRLQPDGSARYMHPQTHRRTVRRDDEAFWLRIAGAGDEVTNGYDVGILMSRGRMLSPEGELTDDCRRWIGAMRSQFAWEKAED